MKTISRALFLSGIIASNLLISNESVDLAAGKYKICCEPKSNDYYGFQGSKFVFIAPESLGDLKRTAVDGFSIVENTADISDDEKNGVKFDLPSGFILFRADSGYYEENPQDLKERIKGFITSHTPNHANLYNFKFDIPTIANESNEQIAGEDAFCSGTVFSANLDSKGVFALQAKQVKVKSNSYWDTQADMYYLISYSFEKNLDEVKKDLSTLSTYIYLASDGFLTQ